MKKDRIISLVSACVLLLFVLLALGSTGSEHSAPDDFDWQKYFESQEKEKMSRLAEAGTETQTIKDTASVGPSLYKPKANIAGNWVGIYTVWEMVSSPNPNLITELGTAQTLMFSVSQMPNCDDVTIILWETECMAIFNSESLELNFFYEYYDDINNEIDNFLFEGIVDPELNSIDGLLYLTWGDGTEFKGTWIVYKN